MTSFIEELRKLVPAVEAMRDKEAKHLASLKPHEHLPEVVGMMVHSQMMLDHFDFRLKEYKRYITEHTHPEDHDGSCSMGHDMEFVGDGQWKCSRCPLVRTNNSNYTDRAYGLFREYSKKLRDKEDKPLQNGDVIDIHQTVNGQRLFVVLDVDAMDIRYFHAQSRRYEYDVKSLLAPDSFNGESTWEIVDNIHKQQGPVN